MKSFKKNYWIVGFIVLIIVGLFFGKSIYNNFFAEKSKVAEITRPAAQINTPQPQLTFEEGKHYHRISPEIIADKNIQHFIAENPGKIQVIEFFNYGCFWCSRLHPLLNTWVKNKPVDVVFYSIPVVFNKKWETLAKAYLIAKNLGKTSTLDSAFFSAIHQNHIDLSEEKELKNFFNKHGITEKQFSEYYQSFAINSELARSIALANAYHIGLSPVIVINTPSGSYLLTAKAAGSEQALISLLNHLLLEKSKKIGS